jgi:asparagine synthase (glutamine-hydrolysing)
MCGIVGIVSFTERSIDEARLTRMRDLLSHRGPDGAGNWLEGAVALGHRRLAIIDVAAGQQPMTTEDGGVWGVFNGEIYNHADLRRELESRGHRYRTRTDTETILHLYEEHGDRVVEHLRGMFAIALWDRARSRLLLARDRLGIKPLYYATTDDELLFASEIKALLAAGVKPQLNDAIVPEYLATRYVSGEATFFRGVRKLSPGHTLTWSAEDGFERRRYWQIPEPASAPATIGFETAVSGLRRHLSAAVRRHLMSDVPLGVFLSGGIDSTALAGIAAGMVDRPLQTFSVGFQEAEANELPYARLAARRLGAEHREVVVSPAEYFDALPRLVWQEDEPIAFTSSVPLYFVSRLACDHVKVVLTGEGSDELFLGYNRYRVTHWNARLGRPYWAVTPRPVRDGVRRLVNQLPAWPRRYLSRTFLNLDPGARSLFFENFAVFPDRLRRDLLARAAQAPGPDPYAIPLGCYEAGSGTSCDRMSRSDLQTYLHELLMKQDQMSMAASIESRVPFLDDDVIEYVAGLPSRYKLRGWTTKAILRAAVRDVVPAEILTRRKMGFPVPIGRWLRHAFKPIVDDLVLGDRAAARGLFDRRALQRLAAEHESGFLDHGDRLWLLANLEIWQRVFVDGETPSSVMTRVSTASGRSYARALGKDGRSLAAEHRRPAAELPHAVGAGPPAPRHGGDHAWSG